ncbi:MAG TPA: hypothetical protein VMF08_10160 [Candidatus Sulfotelmatobacter sp.]|nr:hypothetical protein [Candidatus Sulfotelmatobacter sp.]
MNKDAGLGSWIIVNVRLANGENVPMVMDTGCPTTCLDTSFEPKLGQRIKTDTLWDFGAKSQINVYAAPKFFLMDTPLMKIGPYVVTHDCRQISSEVGHPIMGILGMDILQNYCIQLDFSSHRVRFLDYSRSNKGGWGAPFDLFEIGDGCFAISNNLVGSKYPGTLIDTGYNQDGWLVHDLFEQWTNPSACLHSPNGVLGRQRYPALDLRGVDPRLLAGGDSHIKLNGIGLRFLARHLVTLDFPEQTLYLRRTSIGPPVDKELQAETKSEGKSAAKFLKILENRGRLPGWSKSDIVAAGRVTLHYFYPSTVIFDIPKQGDAFIYHYTLARASDSGSWTLQRAWQTDAAGKTVKEFNVP